MLMSVDGKHPGAARVVVEAVEEAAVVVSCHKPLPVARLDPDGSAQWRLDRDEAASTYVHMRTNLLRLAAGGSEGARWLRGLVVDLAAPRACVEGGVLEGQEEDTGARLAAAKEYVSRVEHGLNADQAAAVQAVLGTRDYSLVLGMPGTGKTTVIVHAIQALAAAGCSVLVSSHTNSAVDNILLKLQAARPTAPPFLRLGHPSSVHPAIQPHLPGGALFPDTSTAALHEISTTVNVVGCTCLSMANPLLARRTFDICILDEAGQVPLPAALAPLLKSRRFVLVGDPQQLPPLVTSDEARQRGYGTSLFSRLADGHPQAVTELKQQYRMAAPIMALANLLTYGGRLACASEAVAAASLHLPLLPHATARFSFPPWMAQALDPTHRVLFLDTDAAEAAQEQRGSDALCNPAEAALVAALVGALLAAGGSRDDVGVMSQYRAQVGLLGRALEARGAEGVEVLTVDRYQGRDKPCMLLSLVRSNPARETGQLLGNWARINVAVTRAKHKLLLVGSASTVAAAPPLALLLGHLRSQGAVVQLPADFVAALEQQQLP